MIVAIVDSTQQIIFKGIMEPMCVPWIMDVTLVSNRNAIFQNDDSNSHVPYPNRLQINFGRAYLLNTLQYRLYDGDNRVYQYKVEISSDGYRGKILLIIRINSHGKYYNLTNSLSNLSDSLMARIINIQTFSLRDSLRFMIIPSL